MKKILFSLILTTFTFMALQAQEETLTNESIIEMIELGFDEEIIIAKIKTSGVNFSTAISDLKLLKEKGASGAIISTMMLQHNENNKEETLSGIYVMRGEEKVKVLPSVFSASKTNTFAAEITGGIASAKVKSLINNANSRNVVSRDNAIFYFYFSPSDQNALSAQGGNDWWFKTATSPNEFALVRLKSNTSKNHRELETASLNAFTGTQIGVNSKKAIPFVIEQVSETEFIVIPETPLGPGEYCFFYQGTIPQGGENNQSVFDFSVQPNL